MFLKSVTKTDFFNHPPSVTNVTLFYLKASLKLAIMEKIGASIDQNFVNPDQS